MAVYGMWNQNPRCNVELERYQLVGARLIFAFCHFGVGVIGFITNDAVKDAAQASTSLAKAMAETGFMNLLLCLACFLGG